MWFKIDDKLHDHHKTRRAGKQAMGVWVLAGSWSADHLTDGFIPADVLARWGTPRDAGRLVTAGLWIVDTQNGEPGWRFRDWSDYQPTAQDVQLAQDARGVGAEIGNHKRWHVAKKVKNPNCRLCQEDS
jgi:hypothetical protein